MQNSDISQAFEALERYRLWFEKAGEALGPFGCVKKPDGDEWSFVEVVEHLLIPEGRVLIGIQNAGSEVMPRLTMKNRIRRLLASVILRFGIKFPVPTKRALPQGGKTAIDLFLEWDELRTKMRLGLAKLSDEQLASVAFMHPLLGPLNVVESLRNGVDHLRYHYIRAKRVFPELRAVPFLD